MHTYIYYTTYIYRYISNTNLCFLFYCETQINLGWNSTDINGFNMRLFLYVPKTYATWPHTSLKIFSASPLCILIINL